MFKSQYSPSPNRLKQMGDAEDAYTKSRNATQEIRRLYNVKNHLLGAGAFGKVYLAESREDPKVKFAVKIMTIKDMNLNIRTQLRNELKILCKLDHPSIAQYVESFEDDKYIYIIMEYCPGKELLSRLEEKGTY